MPFNFWSRHRELIGSIKPQEVPLEIPEESGFPIHPSASELAEQMLVDPSVLQNETYEPGIYDESGDYYPQYSDNPADMPEYFEPAPLDSGDTAPESVSADGQNEPSPEGKENPSGDKS